jgi:hypothetical protein
MSSNLDSTYQSESSYNGLSSINIVVRTSFMQGLQGKAKKWESLGHHLEPVLANQLLQHSVKGKTMAAVLEIHKLFRVGLVQKRNQPGVKCSLDYFGVGEIDGLVSGFAIEVKTRVTSNTSQNSIELARWIVWIG